MRKQAGTITQVECCNYGRVEKDLTYSLVGEIDAESSRCNPTSGSLVSEELRSIYSPDRRSIATVNKVAADEYWTVSVTDGDGEIIREFFARRLEGSFFCDYQELE